MILAGDEDDVAYICLRKKGTYKWYPLSVGSTGVDGEGDLPTPDVPGGDEPTVEDAKKAILGTGKLGYLILGQE